MSKKNPVSLYEARRVRLNAVEIAHIIQALYYSYTDDEWCAVCDSIEEKLTGKKKSSHSTTKRK